MGTLQAPRQQCSHRAHHLAGSIVLWMHRPPAKPEAFEAKEAQETATEVLASASKTLLQARQAGVPVPVLRLRLMQVRLLIAGPCLYPRGALRRLQNRALLTPLRAGLRTGPSNNRRSSVSPPQTRLRGGRRELTAKEPQHILGLADGAHDCHAFRHPVCGPRHCGIRPHCALLGGASTRALLCHVPLSLQRG
jgi:hypothetical protein